MRFSITRKIREDELQVQPLDVAQRIDRAVRVGHGRVLERADDVEHLVGGAQPRELIGGNLGRLAAVDRQRRRGQVDVRDVGRHLTLGLEELGQLRQPLVGDLDHTDVDGHAAESAGVGLAASQSVENGRLARPGKSDDRYLHRRRLVALSNRRADRPG